MYAGNLGKCDKVLDREKWAEASLRKIFSEKNQQSQNKSPGISIEKIWSWKSPGNKEGRPMNIYLKHKAGELRIAVWLMVITLKHDLKGEAKGPED